MFGVPWDWLYDVSRSMIRLMGHPIRQPIGCIPSHGTANGTACGIANRILGISWAVLWDNI